MAAQLQSSSFLVVAASPCPRVLFLGVGVGKRTNLLSYLAAQGEPFNEPAALDYDSLVLGEASLVCRPRSPGSFQPWSLF